MKHSSDGILTHTIHRLVMHLHPSRPQESPHDKVLSILTLLSVLVSAVLFLAAIVSLENMASAQEPSEPDVDGVTILVGPPDPGMSSLVASRDNIRADGVSTSQLTAKVRDAGNNLVPNVFVGFTTNLGTTSHAFAEAEGGAVTKTPGGAWVTKSDIPDASGGSYIEVNATGYPTATVSWSFAGGAFRLRYRAAPDGAIALIQIDSTPITVDTYAATAQWLDFTRIGLSPGHHTVLVKPYTIDGEPQKNTASSAYLIRLDLFQAGETTSVVLGEATSTLTSALLASGSQTATVQATIIGSLITKTTTVTMTASAPQTVTVQANPGEIAAGGGAFGTSNVTATVKDQFSQDVADGTFVHFTTTLGSIAPFQYVDSSDAAVTKTGSWSCFPNIWCSSNSTGAKVSFSFTGAAISLIHRYVYDAGIANVRIDGGATFSGTLNMFSLSSEWPVETPIATNLSPDAHTIEVEVSGITPPGSSGSFVYVTAFRVGTQTSGGKAYAMLTSGTATGVATITATAIGSTAVGTTTVNIIPNVADTGTSSVSANPSQIPANGTMTSTLTALARNKLGGPVSGTIVGFTSDKGTNSKPTYKYAEAETDPSVSWSGGWVATGTAICPSPFLSGTTGVATYTFQASAVSVVHPKLPGTNLLKVYIDGLLAKTIDQGNVTTNTCGFKTLITDTLDPNITHFLTATVAPGSNAFIDAFESGAATDSTGQATGVLTAGTVTGRATITATISKCGPVYGGTVLVTNTIYLGEPAATIDLTASPSSIRADGVDASLLKAIVRDEFNNPTSGQLVTFTTSLGILGSSTITKTTAPDGEATASLKGTQVGTAYITATAKSPTGNIVPATTIVTFIAGPPVTVTLSPIQLNITCCVTSTITATLQDQLHNPVTDGTPVTFTSSLTPSVTFVDPNPVLTVNGVATMTVHGQVAGTAGTITGTTLGGVFGTTGITVATSLPTQLSLEKSKDTIKVGSGPQSRAIITATVADACGNLLNGIPVTFTLTTGQGSFDPSMQITQVTMATSNGVVTKNLYGWDTPGTAVISVTTGYVTQTISVIVFGNPDNVSLVAYPSTIQVGGDTSVLTATVEDALNQPVFDGTVVTFATSLGSIAPPTGTTTGGVIAAVLTSTVAGTALVTATADTVSATIPVTFTPLFASTVTVTAAPTSIVVGGGRATITATVTDQYGNRVADNTPVIFTTTSLGTIVEAQPRFTSNGVATATLASGNIIGTVIVSAMADSHAGQTTVQLLPAAPATVTVTAYPASIPVGMGTAIITASVTDQYGNPVSNGTVVTLTASLGGTLNPVTRTTTSGVATSLLTAGPIAGTATVTVTAGTVWGTATVVFTPGPPANMPGTILVASPTSIPIGGATSAVTATIRDLYGNFVANGTGVSFATTLGTFQQSGSTTYNTTTTGGVALTTLVSGLSTGTAQVSAVAGVVLRMVEVTFTIGPPASMTVTASPPSILIVTGSSTVTATVRDVGNNLVADGVVVNFATSLGTIDPLTATTTNGIATTTLTAGTRTGTAIVTATVDTIWATTNVTFTTPYPPYTVTVTAYLLQIPADGVSTSTITVTVTDIYGNLVADGNLANFFVTSGAMIAPASAPTAGGIVTATLTAGTTPTTVTVRVIVGSRLGEARVVLYLPPRYKLYLPVLYKNFSGGW